MEPVNRFALIVRPKRRYLEWANQLDSDEPRLTVDQLPSLTEVYLVDATDTEADREELIDAYSNEIWEQQLDQWSTDEKSWPSNRTPHTLRDWFDITVVDIVYDADPDVDMHEHFDEARFAEEQMRTCQWCGRVVAPDDPVVTLPVKLSDDDPLKARPAMVFPMTIAGTIRAAVKARPDSPMAREGKDLLFAFCSDECAEALRDAIMRERAALLS